MRTIFSILCAMAVVLSTYASPISQHAQAADVIVVKGQLILEGTQGCHIEDNNGRYLFKIVRFGFRPFEQPGTYAIDAEDMAFALFPTGNCVRYYDDAYGKEVEDYFTQGYITITAPDGMSGEVEAVAEFVGYSGTTYQVSTGEGELPPPTPGEKELTCGEWYYEEVDDPSVTGKQLYHFVIKDKTDKYTLKFAYSTDLPFYGEYTESNGLNMDFSWMFITVNGKDTEIGYEKATLHVVKGDNEGSFTAEATVEAEDGNTYHITAVETGVPEVENTIAIKATNMSRSIYMDYLEYTNSIEFLASNDAYEVVILLEAEVSGTYTLPAAGSVEITDKATGNTNEATLKSGSLTLDKEANPMTLKGTALFSNGVEYELDLAGSYLSDDIDDGKAVDCYFTEATATVEIKPYPDLGYYDCRIIGNTEETALSIYVDEVTEQLPAGEYTIDYTNKPGTVGANHGIVYMTFQTEYLGSTISPSFYATSYIEEGEVFFDKIHMFTSGKVCIAYDADDELQITVEAKNSYDIPVKVVYGSPITAIENAIQSQETTKYIDQDGQLRIRRGETTYSATGQLIK